MLNLFSSSSKAELERERKLISRESAEIRQISDTIITKLEGKILTLEAMESSIDKKIAAFENLLQQAETISSGADMNRPHEIMALYEKGLKAEEIANVLAMPMGEVHLILELQMQHA